MIKLTYFLVDLGVQLGQLTHVRTVITSGLPAFRKFLKFPLQGNILTKRSLERQICLFCLGEP